MIGYSGFFIGMPLLFTKVLGVAPEYLAGVVSIVAALTIIGPIIANKLAKKHKFRKSLFTSSAIVGLSIMAFAISNSLMLAIIIFAILNICLVIFDIIIESAQGHAFDSEIRASLGSIGGIIRSVSGSIGVFLAGFGVNYLGIVNTLLISGAIIFLTAFAYLGMKE
jgi:MFS family permease